MEQHGEELGWIEAAQRGDHLAFARLVEEYQAPVYNLAYRMLGNGPEAEDVAQEVFLRAYVKLASYDRSRRFSTWLLSIASNYCIDMLRRRRAALTPLEDAEFALADLAPGPEQSALDDEQRQIIARAIEALPPAYRLPTILRYNYDLPYAEVERVTGLTEATIKTRLHRARRMMKDLLEQRGALPWSAETSGR